MLTMTFIGTEGYLQEREIMAWCRKAVMRCTVFRRDQRKTTCGSQVANPGKNESMTSISTWMITKGMTPR